MYAYRTHPYTRLIPSFAFHSALCLDVSEALEGRSRMLKVRVDRAKYSKDTRNNSMRGIIDHYLPAPPPPNWLALMKGLAFTGKSGQCQLLQIPEHRVVHELSHIGHATTACTTSAVKLGGDGVNNTLDLYRSRKLT